MLDPMGMEALVPVVKKPTTGTRSAAATTPPVPVTPLSSKDPFSRTCRSPRRSETTRADVT